LAGVSQSAVSRAFSGGGSVSSDTRDRVLEAARTLGYRPNAIARGLITRRSNLVGLILPSAASLYYPEVTVGLTAEVAKRGARVLLITVETPAEVGGALEQLWSFQVDGVIAATALTAEQLSDFELHRTPVIFYNRAPPHHAGNSVGVDHADGEGRLVSRLWAAGHRRFAMITGPSDSAVARERAAGAVDTLTRLGGEPPVIVPGDYRYESGVEAFGALVATGRPLDVVLCANDAMALGAVDAARWKHGLQIPEDVSVAGFDGFGAGRWLAYQLTTVRQPIETLAAAAVEMLFARIENPDLAPERRLFSGEIVCGRSARLGPG
jgi:DNA-binding LacI/PurR family transcriptional regulator